MASHGNLYQTLVMAAKDHLDRTGSTPDSVGQVAALAQIDQADAEQIFATPQAIHDGLIYHGVTLLNDALREGVLESDSQNPVAQLRSLAEGYGEWAERNPALFRLLVEGLNQPMAEDGTLLRYTLSMRELFLRKLAEMRELGILAKDTNLNDIVLVLHALVKGANTLFTTRSFDPWLQNDSRSGRLLTRMIFDEFINGILRAHAPENDELPATG